MGVTGLLLALAAAIPEIPESQLETRVRGQEVFASAFRGTWAKSAAACKEAAAADSFVITDTLIQGYEWDGRLLMTTPMIWQSDPVTEHSIHTVVVLTADREETDVAIGKHRISLLDGKIYMSNPDRTAEDRHISAAFAYVRCADVREPGGL